MATFALPEIAVLFVANVKVSGAGLRKAVLVSEGTILQPSTA